MTLEEVVTELRKKRGNPNLPDGQAHLGFSLEAGRFAALIHKHTAGAEELLKEFLGLSEKVHAEISRRAAPTPVVEAPAPTPDAVTPAAPGEVPPPAA